MLIADKIKSLKNDRSFMKYFKNTSWLLIEKIIRVIVYFFVWIWVARYLGPKQFGILNFSQSFVALFLVFSTLGLDSIAIKELVKKPEKRNMILGTAFILKLVGALFSIIIIAISIEFSSSDNNTKLMVIIIAAGLIFQSMNVIDFYFQSKVQGKYVALCNIAVISISSTVKVILILCHSPLIYFAYTSILDSLILSIGLMFFYHQNKLSIYKWVFKLAIARQLLSKSWPLIISSISIILYMRIDQVMINAFFDSNEVGIYAAATKISEAWYFIPIVITASLFPAIIDSYETDIHLYRRRLSRLYKLMLIISAAIIIPTTLLAPIIIPVVFGEEYRNSSDILTLHIWAGIFVSIGVANSKRLITENLQKFSSINTFIGAISNIILNLILIPTYGGKGAAVATLISQFVSAYFCLYFFKDTRIMFKDISASIICKRIT
ncbi:MAG: flippase [Gammaproteobacteria bacterium]|nr:MAG: flippase [Gammaproteobacteria bacterium]